MILTSFSFIYENKTEEFTKPRFDHTFDYLRLNKRMRFNFEIEFEIVEDSTKRGRNKLVDRRGYTYNVKRRQGRNTDWQCTVRPKVQFYIHFFQFFKQKIVALDLM